MAGAFNPRTGGQLETSENNEENLSQKMTTGLKWLIRPRRGPMKKMAKMIQLRHKSQKSFKSNANKSSV